MEETDKMEIGLSLSPSLSPSPDLSSPKDSDSDALEVWKHIPPTGLGIGRLIQKARRYRAWYRSLRFEERRYLEALSRLFDAIRSPLVLKVAGSLLGRLLKALRSFGIGDLGFMMERIGKPLAKRISLIALRWGYWKAYGWARDKGFIRYLTVMSLNAPLGYGSL
jgi:hypothetical protein